MLLSEKGVIINIVYNPTFVKNMLLKFTYTYRMFLLL